MSDYFAIARAVGESSLSQVQRHVVLVVSLAASGSDGTCYASVSTLAQQTGLSTRTIQKTLAVLIEKCWLVRDVRAGQTAALRVVARGRSRFTPPTGESADSTGGGERGSPPPPNEVHPTPEPRSPHPRTSFGGSPRTEIDGDGVVVEQQGGVFGQLIDDPDHLRLQVALPNARELATLLEQTQARLRGYAFAPADLMSLGKALRSGFTVAQLLQVWDHHNTEGVMSTELARTKGWAASWKSLANKNLAGRVRDARMWDQAGRPTASGQTRPDWLFNERTT